MEKREIRRDWAIRVGERRQKLHVRVVHPEGALDCECERSARYFAKRTALGCNCRRRWPGRPKLALSLCHGGGMYHPSVVERIAWRRLAHAWLRELRGARDADDIPLPGRDRLTRR
jgi:hypothetical protein